MRLRRELHRAPELSGSERETAAHIADRLTALDPDELREGLGGHGVAAVFAGEEAGPTVLLRCELDALPIQESTGAGYASRRPRVAHACGHDGHMAIMDCVARQFSARRPRRGRVVVLFQPSEENGVGARAVIADPRFGGLEPDHVFALHNVPGHRHGAVIVRDGVFALASRGLEVHWRGRTAHAAEPEKARNPGAALLATRSAWARIAEEAGREDNVVMTVVHAHLGERDAFGTTPGEAVLQATLRAPTAARVDALERSCREAVEREEGIEVEISIHDPFPETANDTASANLVREVARRARLPVDELAVPFKWSEDFGHFTGRWPGAMFGLGSGEDQPSLHHPDYDFPDEIIDPGVAVMEGVARELVGGVDPEP